MHDPEEVAVSARELTRRFGAFTAVDRVSFRVRRGEVFGFLGPNGAGKTTVIRMLCGLLPLTEGEAAVDGLDLRTQRSAVKRRIGYMSQRFSLYADLTVGENLELFAGLYGVAGEHFRDRRRWVLDMAGLVGSEGRLVETLPLGWKQRLALGCAVLHEPSILFLDEPTSGVDPLTRRAFWDLIDELAAGGTTVFVTTHYMEEAEYCHRLGLMNRGELIALDAPSRLIASLADPLLEVTTDDPLRAVTVLEGATGIRDAALFGRSVHVSVDDEASGAAAVRAHLSSAGVPHGAVRPVAPSLEHVFVSLIRREGGAREG